MCLAAALYGIFGSEAQYVYAVLFAGVIALGAYGVYYGVRYQQSQAGVEIGEALGFSPTEMGLRSEDSYYTAKGSANGFEVFIYILQNPQNSRSGAWFKLEVMCRIANPTGLALEIYTGLLNRPLRFSSLPPRVRGVPDWEDCVVRCNFPEAPARLLAGVPYGGRVLNGDFGFQRLGLRDGKMQAYFRRSGYVEKEYVANAIEEVSKLAAKANLG